MIALDGRTLTLDRLAAIAGGAPVALDAAARERVAAGEERLRRMMAEGAAIYGVTSGFGALDGAPVPAEKNETLQRNLLRSHAAGVGRPMAERAVRAMMALRANVLASGQTGVKLATLEALIAALNAGLVPDVPEQGSVGACGDLAPLAHMALLLIGEGRARRAGEDFRPARELLEASGLAPVSLAGRDGIALINGTEQATAIMGLALTDACRLIAAAEAVAVLSLEALGGLDDAFDRRVALAKPHPGQIACSEAMTRLSQGSTSIGAPRPGRLRDALSLRCIPQVIGAARDAVAHAVAGLTVEINAVNDNPIFDLADGWVTSNSGNFHGQAVAELRQRAVPGSIQSVPTCANTEDHVPMSPLSARRLAFVVETGWQVVAIELLLAAQALDLRGIPAAPALHGLIAGLREAVPTMVEDRVIGDDIAAALAVLTASAGGADLPPAALGQDRPPAVRR